MLLRLIEERSAAFRAAVAAAPGLEAPVPTCPEWTLLELVEHVGQGHRRWAATVADGPADAPPADEACTDAAPREREALLAWSAGSTDQLLAALRASGPDRGCWTWWGGSQSPQTCGAVARHQLQQVAVYTYDAQVTAGAPEPLPGETALDGVDKFLFTCCAGPYAWPYEPCVVGYDAVEGPSWHLALSGDGVRAGRAATPGTPADATLRATASDLVLALYGRIRVDSLQLDGDGRLFDLLLAWEPD